MIKSRNMNFSLTTVLKFIAAVTYALFLFPMLLLLSAVPLKEYENFNISNGFPSITGSQSDLSLTVYMTVVMVIFGVLGYCNTQHIKSNRKQTYLYT